MKKRLSAMLLCVALLLNFCVVSAEDAYSSTGFELIKTQESNDLGGTLYYFRHIKTGAEVVWLDNNSERRDFSIGFKTPPIDSKGANHVLEHSLLCGSEKYPTKNIMPYVRGNALAETINAVTSDDCTYYEIKTPNETEYYNLIDVYMNGIFHPLLLTDENIFKQQGIRLEYVDGKVQYNGVVYNELRINSLDSTENSVNFLADTLYRSIYGNTAPACNSGGSINDLKTLTYEDVLRVYNTYYIPSNSMTYLAGKQDIKKTLSVLDGFFKSFDKQNITISFSDTKQQPAEKVSEYNITADTKTVDIGFMSAGVPMAENMTELYAKDIIFNLIAEKMDEINSKNYVSGGNSGGISNTALLVTEVPIEKKDKILAAYDTVLADFSQNGLGDIADTIDNYVTDRNNPYFYTIELGIFQGILYHDNPFYYADISTAANTLKESPELFDAVLKKYFTNNPCSKIVISGNHGAMTEEPLQFSDAEIEQIKRETEQFQAWADMPDSPEVIAKIPTLSLDDIDAAPAYAAPLHEVIEKIDFYYTAKPEQDGAFVNMFFPVQADTKDLAYLQLMTAFINTQAVNAGYEGVTIDLISMEDYHDSEKINPQISIYLSGSGQKIAENISRFSAFLREDTTWDRTAFETYVKNTPVQILQNGYRDPYFLSYELKQTKQTAGNAFYSYTRGSIGQGSVPYYQLLKNARPEEYPAMLKKINDMCSDMMLNSIPLVEYVGAEGYDAVKQAVTEQFKSGKKKESGSVLLPAGYPSAATITRMTDANHFMLSGNIKETGYSYSGKMWVAGNVLTANYLLPTMRGKYGAYGASIAIDPSGLTSGVAGISQIDLAIEVWNGMGDYLRDLTMTQKELDAAIIPIIKEFDEYYNDSDFGGILALSNKTSEDIKRTREEILSTTVEDLRGYADLIDALVAQQKVYAVLSREAADKAEFDFAYYADAETLNLYPRFTKKPQSYISGKSETQFCPDDVLTRGEAAVLIERLLADQSSISIPPSYTDVHAADWYYEAIAVLSERGILHGYSDGAFRPNETITRAEFVSVLAQFVYGTDTVPAISCNDITEEDWFYPAMAKMAAGGFLSGYGGGMLYPNKTITRAEAVTLINRVLGKAYIDGMQNPFTDTQGHWAFEEITAAVN